ncbi:MAG TPA: hypothetical protein VNI01_10630 [Elusimicrobiota bacterium]|nr:hypothetical protein [Elusimicrobiota bacterium]
MSRCAACERALGEKEERFVPPVLRYAAAFLFAFAHAGMWAMQILAKPFCPRCRGLLVPSIVVACAGAVAAVGWAVRYWLRASLALRQGK